MFMGRLLQSPGATTMKDRPLMVTFLKRFGVLRKMPLLLIVNRYGMAVRGKLNQ